MKSKKKPRKYKEQNFLPSMHRTIVHPKGRADDDRYLDPTDSILTDPDL